MCTSSLVWFLLLSFQYCKFIYHALLCVQEGDEYEDDLLTVSDPLNQVLNPLPTYKRNAVKDYNHLFRSFSSFSSNFCRLIWQNIWWISLWTCIRMTDRTLIISSRFSLYKSSSLKPFTVVFLLAFLIEHNILSLLLQSLSQSQQNAIQVVLSRWVHYPHWWIYEVVNWYTVPSARNIFSFPPGAVFFVYARGCGGGIGGGTSMWMTLISLVIF